MPSKINTIVVKDSDLYKFVEFARINYPYESCALCIGKIDKNRATIDEIFFSKNVKQSQVSFEIEPEFQLMVREKAGQENKELTAIFHSHPIESVPSGIDIKFMRYNPEVWVILGVLMRNPDESIEETRANIKKEDIKAYQLVDESLNEVKLEIIHD